MVIEHLELRVAVPQEELDAIHVPLLLEFFKLLPDLLR